MSARVGIAIVVLLGAGQAAGCGPPSRCSSSPPRQSGLAFTHVKGARGKYYGVMNHATDEPCVGPWRLR